MLVAIITYKTDKYLYLLLINPQNIAVSVQ